MQKYFPPAGIAMVLLVGSGYARADIFSTPNRDEEIAIGRQLSAEVDRTYSLRKDPELVDRVQRISELLVSQLEATERVYPYTFKILRDPTYNAFALPGGFIYFNDGLLSLARTDEELAFVIAHELTHSAHRHWAQQFKKISTMNVLLSVLGAAAGTNAQTVGAVIGSFMVLSYSRDQERDADATALRLMWKAGIDLEGAVRAAEMLAELGKKDKTPRWLSTHPPGADRLRDIRKRMETLKQSPPSQQNRASSPVGEIVDTEAIVGDITGLQMAYNDYYPLKVGNSWNYEIRSQGISTSYTITVVAEVPARDASVYRNAMHAGSGNTLYYLILTTVNGIYRKTFNPSDISNAAWRLDYWLSPDVAPVSVSGDSFVVRGSERITVPAGTFENALRVEKTTTVVGKSKMYTAWFVVGVGMVKRQTDGLEEVLVSYQVGK